MITNLLWVFVLIGCVWAFWPSRGSSVKVPLRMNMHVNEMKLDALTWQRFCCYAAIVGRKQPELLGEAVREYLERHTK